MRINPIDAVRKITADFAAYTRQIFEKKVGEQTERTRQEPVKTTTDTSVQFDQLLEKIPANHTVLPAAMPAVASYQELAALKLQSGTYEHALPISQRISVAQKAYEGSMVDQGHVTIEPFDSRA
ncbi:hypothetical protein ACE3MZ_14270 [Paenibacillus sp. WLX1005]|uniref:hypothetical protein n=1 Tax=Paenibacillus sp. WLX1005 TaxID=3243766 RepID=UPI0039840CC7